MEFLRAKLEDADTLAALVNRSYRGESSKAGWTTEADLIGGQRTDADRIREMILGQNSFILRDRAHPVRACVYLEKRAEICYLGMLTVEPSLQSKGYGSQLLQAAERFARERMLCTRMEMTVISRRQELVAWYERKGYRRSDRTEPFPYGDVRFGEPKTQDLVFAVLEKTL